MSVPTANGPRFGLVSCNGHACLRCEMFLATSLCQSAGRYPPPHGISTWPESELSVLASQCLDRRIAGDATLSEEIAAWQFDRNAQRAKANSHFTTPDAGVKLEHMYPSC